jgi:hypothetical protein
VWFGPLSPNVLGRITFRQIWNNVGVGVKHGFLLGKNIILGGLGQLAGPFGRAAIQHVLIKK